MLPYNKIEIVRELLGRVNGRISQLVETVKDYQRASNEAEGAMQTRYGTAKEENRDMADTLRLRLAGRSGDISQMATFNLPENPDEVKPGTLVRLVNGDGSYTNYFIFPNGSGETVTTEEGEVIVISPNTPLAKSMLGRRKGEEFEVSLPSARRSYRVDSLY